LQVNSHAEDTALLLFDTFRFTYVLAFAVFWIFLIWVLWKIVQCLKCAATSLKEIAESLKNKG